jgi:hypothetical protein
MSKETDTTTQADTAPSIKKQDQQASAKKSIVMPIVLLLATAIVIGATVYKYQDEQNTLKTQAQQTQGESENISPVNTAETDSSAATAQTSSSNKEEIDNAAEQTQENDTVAEEEQSSPAETPATESVSKNTEQAGNAEQADESGETPTPAADTTSVEKTSLSATTNVSDRKPDDTDKRWQQIDQRIADMRARFEKERADFANERPYEQDREAAFTKAREQANKRHEKMMQLRMEHEKEMEARRQKFEQEMQERRKQYNAMRKDRYESRQTGQDSRDAEYQRLDQIRTDARKKVDERMKRIAELQNEIRQIIRDSREQYWTEAEKLYSSPSPTPASR